MAGRNHAGNCVLRRAGVSFAFIHSRLWIQAPSLRPWREVSGRLGAMRFAQRISDCHPPAKPFNLFTHFNRFATMDRRKFVATFAAVGASSALPALGEAQSNPQRTAQNAPPLVVSDGLRMAFLRDETTRQLNDSLPEPAGYFHDQFYDLFYSLACPPPALDPASRRSHVSRTGRRRARGQRLGLDKLAFLLRPRDRSG